MSDIVYLMVSGQRRVLFLTDVEPLHPWVTAGK